MSDGRLRERWRSLDTATRFVVVVAVAFVVVRTLVATQSGYTFHQGWNEGWYSLIAASFLSDPLVPRSGHVLVFNTTPLFPYLVAGWFTAFGFSEVVARMPTILLAGGTVLATYALGYATYDDRRVAAFGSGLLATLPYFQLYGGRAQTDVAMVFFFTASLAAIVYGYQRPSRTWVISGGLLFGLGVAAKQPVLVLPGVVLLWLVANRRFDVRSLTDTGLLILSGAVGLVPLVVWEYLNYVRYPTAFVSDWQYELLGRTEYFANVPLNLGIGVGLGMTPLVVALVGVLTVASLRRHRLASVGRALSDPVVLWLLLYGLFVAVRTPHGHQYYLVALTPPVALLAARGAFVVREWVAGADRSTLVRPLLALLVLSTLSGTVVLFELSGEYSVANGGGERIAPETASYLVENAPENATVVVERGYRTQFMWYGRGHIDSENVVHVPSGEFSREQLAAVVADAEGPVYVVYPEPAWGEQTRADMTEVYRSEPYRFTIMRVAGEFVSTDSKFTYYLNDRQLVVYRVERSAFEG